MNNRILLAFAGGAALAGGVVYFAMKKTANPVVPVASSMQATQAVAQPAQGPPSQAAPAAQVAPAVSAPAPEKTEPPAKAEKKVPVKVARHRPAAAPAEREPAAQPAEPPTPAAPAPAPAPAPEPEKKVEVTSAVPPAQPTPPSQPTPENPPAPPPPPPEPPTVTVPAGTLITVRLGETLSSDRNQPNDSFMATLDQPLAVDGFVIAERGSRVEGRVVQAEKAGKVKGVSRLAVELTKIHTSDGQTVRIQTAMFEKEGETSKKEDAAKVGAVAAIGAAIGAIAGGGKGAGIGAAAGGAAGAGDVMLTRGKPVELQVETRISFRLDQPVTITEKLP